MKLQLLNQQYYYTKHRLHQILLESRRRQLAEFSPVRPEVDADHPTLEIPQGEDFAGGQIGQGEVYGGIPFGKLGRRRQGTKKPAKEASSVGVRLVTAGTNAPPIRAQDWGFGSEILVDWLKHIFVTRFNPIKVAPALPPCPPAVAAAAGGRPCTET